MGFAIAEAARQRGARVTLVVGPTTLNPPPADTTVRVRSAREMHAAITSAAAAADVIIMAAAVADYAPAQVAKQKVAKTDGSLTLTLERTPDILADLGRTRQNREVPLLVGFAAETSDLLARAREKRVRKRVDVIVANDVSAPGAGFDAPTNAVTIVDGDGEHAVARQSKALVAEAILDRIEALMRNREASASPA